jgi:hypothetical protein
MKGAFPPASMETLGIHKRYSAFTFGERKGTPVYFFMVDAAIPYNNFATGVDPVKLIFFTILFSQSSLPTSDTFF